ncbi:MAG: redoxin domain-containing protein [Planctomycetota bacterium]
MGLFRAIAAAFVAAFPLVALAAPEFPPGVWSDGGDYSIDDFDGKVLVLVFYDDGCSKCAASTEEYAKLQEAFEDEPVYVFAVAVNDSETSAAQYAKTNGMGVPVFVDNAGLLTAAYGLDIPHDGNRKFMVVRPDGSIRNCGFMPNHATDHVGELAEDVATMFDFSDVPEIFVPVLRDIEIGKWGRALRTAEPGLRSPDDAVREATERLFVTAEEQADVLLAEAAEANDAGDALAAMLKYETVVEEFSVFPDRVTAARKAARPLQKHPDVQKEMAARERYAMLTNGLRQATPQQADDVRAFARKLVTEFPDTPTAKRVEGWLKVADD